LSLAELAAKSEYWAVRNLCRRRVVSLEEFTEEFEGKNVIQWAEHHNHAGFVEELKYFFCKLKVSLCKSTL
jgi:hypothetical protein